MTHPLSPLQSQLLLGAALALASTGACLACAMHGPTTETSVRSWAAVPCAAHAVTARTPSYRYAWPLKPFREQHPVRGFFGDPRIANLGRSRQFHFGVDVSAPDGTPVYATLTGLIRIHPLHATTVLIDGAGGLEFEYWHIVPTVRTGQRAVAYRTVIGRIEAPYAHVHFSEARNGRYLNPLRPGAMGPFVDHTRPEVAAILAERAGRVLQSSSIRGAFDLVAEVRDETPMAIPRPWHDLPVTPALVRWRLLRQGRVVLGWQAAIDFRETIPPAYEFDRTWAPGTTQNHVRLPGRYRVFLSHALGAMRAGPYVVQVAVRDTRRNAATVSVRLTIGSAVS